MRRKASGKPIKVGEREEKPDNVVNLMDALKASLKGKPAAKRRRRGATPGTGTTGGEEGASFSGEAAQGGVISLGRHGRACPGHPRLTFLAAQGTWMPGTSPA